MRSDEITFDPDYQYVLVINGKPATQYSDYISAKWEMEMLRKSNPQGQYEIRKQVCKLVPAPDPKKPLEEKWSAKYKKSINCSNPKGFSQRAHCQGRKKRLKEDQQDVEHVKKIIYKFLAFAKASLELDSLPKIKFYAVVPERDQPTFGRYHNDTHTLEVGIVNRQPMDILRTIAHELVHYRQQQDNVLGHGSGETGSPEENEANAGAGILMREFGKLHPKLFREAPIVSETIRKVGNKYRLVSKKSGRNLGTYNTRAEAKKRERQVQYFKHKK